MVDSNASSTAVVGLVLTSGVRHFDMAAGRHTLVFSWTQRGLPLKKRPREPAILAATHPRGTVVAGLAGAGCQSTQT